MDSFTPKERSVNFSKAEKELFQALIEKYKEVLFNKKTDNISNIKKNRTWTAIHGEFNANADHPRTLRQLKAKFDNMKKHARKDASQERQARFKTGGGPPPSPPHRDTEWFRTLMPISMDGLPSVVDDDYESQATTIIGENNTFENGNAAVEIDKENTGPSTKEDSKAAVDIEQENTTQNSEEIISVIVLKDDDNVFDTKAPASLLRKPVSKPLRVRTQLPKHSNTNKEAKFELMKQMYEFERHIYKTKLHNMAEKRKEEKELYELKKRKILLELDLLSMSNK